MEVVCRRGREGALPGPEKPGVTPLPCSLFIGCVHLRILNEIVTPPDTVIVLTDQVEIICNNRAGLDVTRG